MVEVLNLTDMNALDKRTLNETRGVSNNIFQFIKIIVIFVGFNLGALKKLLRKSKINFLKLLTIVNFLMEIFLPENF